MHVHLGHDPGLEWPCPECGKPCPLYDHQPERRWRHLDTCQFRTILHAEPPRSNCSEHGPRTVKLPWAEPNSRFTALFEGIAIEWLKVASQKAVADQLGLSWDEVHGIQQRAVARGLARRKEETIEHIGVDEKAFTRGHRYFTLVNDLDRGRVLFVAENRTEESLNDFWSRLSEEQIHAVKAVAMDMWDPYVNSTRRFLRRPMGRSSSICPQRWTLCGAGRTSSCERPATTGSREHGMTGCAIPRAWSRRIAGSSQRCATAT